MIEMARDEDRQPKARLYRGCFIIALRCDSASELPKRSYISQATSASPGLADPWKFVRRWKQAGSRALACSPSGRECTQIAVEGTPPLYRSYPSCLALTPLNSYWYQYAIEAIPPPHWVARNILSCERKRTELIPPSANNTIVGASLPRCRAVTTTE